MAAGSNPHAPLLANVSQYDVDFVIPKIGVDVPVGIDPFLLFKGRDSGYKNLHDKLIRVFNAGIDAVRRGAVNEARYLFDFPEVAAIGLGYTRKSKRGSGVGTLLTGLIIETLSGSPPLQERGVRHVEEMQLVSARIGPDRVSDIAANVLKRFLISYTQRQCAIWNLPMKSGVPVAHIYNESTQVWEDSHEDLPVSPADGSAILLVPRRIVRTLPWINYDDFLRSEFNAYLAARRQASIASALGADPTAPVFSTKSKRDVVTITRKDIALDYVDEDACREAEALKKKLKNVAPGRLYATDYQRVVLEILNYLFSPELIDGRPEIRTFEGTERRDIIFTNDSDESFWDYVRTTHDGIVVMFEAKNTDELDLAAINQTATYLGDRLGRLGVIVSRRPPPESIQRKLFSIWNDSAPNRKVILTLSDEQLCKLLDLRCGDGSPTKWMQDHYREFRTSVQ